MLLVWPWLRSLRILRMSDHFIFAVLKIEIWAPVRFEPALFDTSYVWNQGYFCIYLPFAAVTSDNHHSEWHVGKRLDTTWASAFRCIPCPWAFCPCREASCLGRKAAWPFILNGVIVNVAVARGISSNRCCYSISTCFLLQAEAATFAGWLFLIFVREQLDLCSRCWFQSRLALLLLVHPPVFGWKAGVPYWRDVAGLMMFKCHYMLQRSGCCGGNGPAPEYPRGQKWWSCQSAADYLIL